MITLSWLQTRSSQRSLLVQLLPLGLGRLSMIVIGLGQLPMIAIALGLSQLSPLRDDGNPPEHSA